MSKVIPTVPIHESDFQFPDHWGYAWLSPSHKWGLTMSTTVEAGWLLYGLVRSQKPLYCIETGTHKGLSALFIGAALRDNGWGHLDTVDIADHGQSMNIQERGLDEWITCHIQDSIQFHARESIDFLFLDAAHGYREVKAELAHFQPNLSLGAIVAIDDSRLNPGEQDAAQEFATQFRSHGFQLLNSRGTYLLKYGRGLEIHDDSKINWLRQQSNFLVRGV